MAKVTLVFAVLLVALGLAGFFGTGSVHYTALIPAWIGLALGACAILAMSPDVNRRKLFAHATEALEIGILQRYGIGVLGVQRGDVTIPTLSRHGRIALRRRRV